MNPITRECQDCADLQKVLSDVDCTILDLSQNKYNSVTYGVKECCNETLFQALSRYKRIITGRLYNPDYPCGEYSSNEILSKARLLTYKTNCSRCPECEEISTTTTTLPPPPGGQCVTILVRILDTEAGGEYPYSYLDCQGDLQTGSLHVNDYLNICVIQGSFVIDSAFYILEYAEDCDIIPGGTCICATLHNTETDQGVVPYKYSYHDCDGGVFTDIPLDFGESVDICVNPNTLITNFAHKLTYHAPCVDACD